jgi:AcrR family transcriptional regulator
MASDALTPGATDGRRLRSEASRERIINALIELLGEGDVAPSAEAVAERAGVGLRTVFRHFDNMESLYQQISARMRAEIVPMLGRPFVALDWRGRVKEAVERRIAIFEKIMPLKVAADVHRYRSDYLAQQGALMIKEQRTALSRLVGDAVGQDDPLFEALDLVLSFEAWRRLRQDQNLTRAKARAVVDHLVEGLLAG